MARAIDSVLAQTFEDWELLISDNGSLDGTRAIAEEYVGRDPRISFRSNETNLGAVANFALVFRETSGEYFMWLAHDDWIAPSYLQECVDTMYENEGTVLAFTGMHVVDDSGLPFRNRTESIDGANSPNPVIRFHSILWGLKDPTSPVFGLMRRSALEKTGLLRNANEPDRILIGELSLLGAIHQNHKLLFYHYGPFGHTERDNWTWLNPRNRGRPRLATLRIISHHWRAIWSSPHQSIDKILMSIDLLAATSVKRLIGKARGLAKQILRRLVRRVLTLASQSPL